MANEKRIKRIRKAIQIWDKWNYDIEKNNFVFFTLHDCLDIGPNKVFIRYKAKEWIKAEMDDFVATMHILTKEEFETFTNHSDTWEFIENG